MVAADVRPKTCGKAAETPATVTPEAAKEDFSEFKRMYEEMVEMREKAKALMESAEQVRATPELGECAGAYKSTDGSQDTWVESTEDQEWYDNG